MDGVGEANLSKLAQQAVQNATSHAKIVTSATVVSSKDTQAPGHATPTSQEQHADNNSNNQSSQQGIKAEHHNGTPSSRDEALIARSAPTPTESKEKDH